MESDSPQFDERWQCVYQQSHDVDLPVQIVVMDRYQVLPTQQAKGMDKRDAKKNVAPDVFKAEQLGS